MGRIQKAYENRFRAWLGRLKARRIEQGVQWLRHRAQALERGSGMTAVQALATACEQARLRLKMPQRNRQAESRPAPTSSGTELSPCFLCDAGLGGLARWLRAAGYEAWWRATIDDDELLAEARRLGGFLLTTDSLLMERRVLREGVLPSLWLPPTMSPPEQLALVWRELGLSRRDPRCMSCGGELIPADKQTLRERIPPRTYRWLDDYYLCARCGKLFWRGTHWNRIEQQFDGLKR